MVSIVMKASLRGLRCAAFGIMTVLLALAPLGAVSAVGLGHGFYGAVTLEGVNAPVGTVITAKVGGTTYGTSTVTTAGSYGLLVQGAIDEEATIRFYVGGQEADQTFAYRDGWTTSLNLTVTGPPVPRYSLTMAHSPGPGGNATDETGGSPYTQGAVVQIKAVPATGYGFVNWTAPAGVFGNATAQLTTFTMPAQNITVTGSFALVYNLTMAKSPVGAGDAVDVDGKGAYAQNATVRIKAEPATGYGFINWTAQPAVTFGNATYEETTFTMPGQAVTITANFGVTYAVTMVEDPAAGGDAVDVGGKGAYAAGATVAIRAVPAAGYGFVSWASQPAVVFGNATAVETTFEMPTEAVTVTASFEAVYALNLVRNPVHAGEVFDVNGKGAYAANATVRVRAEPATGYGFVNWTAPPVVAFVNATAEETTFTMPPQAVTVVANFASTAGAPSVTTEAATGVTTYSGNLNMSYTLGSASSVDLRFAAKRPTDPSWFHTPWESKAAAGTYTYPLTGLAPQTDYDFKAQVKHNDTVVEGAVVRFTTAEQPNAGFGFDLSALGCFIATAAYGTPAAEQIDVLREFRDTVLIRSVLGSTFVALYYRLSPPVAAVIAGNGFYRALVRELLIDPIVWVVRAKGDLWRQE
jgi:hypothetical protein